MRRRLPLAVLLLAAAAAGGYAYLHTRPTVLVLTGIVTTNDVIVSPQIARTASASCSSRKGDTVRHDQLLAVITPDELRADTAYYAQSAQGCRRRSGSGSGAALPAAADRRSDRPGRVDARSRPRRRRRRPPPISRTRGSSSSARRASPRNRSPRRRSSTRRRTAFKAAQARVDALNQQVEAAALGGRAGPLQRRAGRDAAASQVQTNQHRPRPPPRSGPRPTCGSRYTEIHAPIDGIVDVRAARAGEVVNAGQPIVTLINPDDLWVRADVEETYIDRVRARRHADGPPAVRRRARRAPCSIAASTPASPRSAT